MPAFITYGDNNRTHMFRTPEPGRFECRAVSGAVNPYLAMAAFIAAGMDGIERDLDPGDPIVGRNMYETTLEEMQARGPARTSRSRWPRRSTSSRRTRSSSRRLGPELAAEFLRVKRQEWVRYHSTVSRWETDQYLTLF